MTPGDTNSMLQSFLVSFMIFFEDCKTMIPLIAQCLKNEDVKLNIQAN